jgi:hypothetical protein
LANEVLWVGGLLNITDPIFGIQLYKWSWLFLLITAGMIWLAYRYGKWEGYKPLWGIYYAFKAKSKAVFIFNRRLHAELLSERDAKCIFKYKEWFTEPCKYNFETKQFDPVPNWPMLGWLQKKIWYYPQAFLDIDVAHGMLYKFGGTNHDVDIAKKMQNYEWDDAHSVNSGGILIDIILDADSWSVSTSPQHRIIERTAEQWNEANPDDQIHAYPKMQRYFLEGKLQVPLGIHPVELTSWPRMDAGCPVNIEDNTMAGARRQEEKDEDEKQNNPFSKYYMPLAIGGFGFAILILIFRFASVWMMHH